MYSRLRGLHLGGKRGRGKRGSRHQLERETREKKPVRLLSGLVVVDRERERRRRLYLSWGVVIRPWFLLRSKPGRGEERGGGSPPATVTYSTAGVVRWGGHSAERGRRDRYRGRREMARKSWGRDSESLGSRRVSLPRGSQARSMSWCSPGKDQGCTREGSSGAL